MQCPNCYADTNAALPLCTRCNAPLPRGQQEPFAEAPRYEYGSPAGPDLGRPREPAPTPWQTGDAARHVAQEPDPWRRPQPPRSHLPLLIALIVMVALGGAVAGGVILWPDENENAAGTTPYSVPSGVPSPDESDTGAVDESEPGGTAEAAGADTHSQAVAIDELLDEMAASRAELGPAVTAASRCDTVAGAVVTLEQVKTDRQEQLGKARDLQVNAFPAGAEIRDALIRAAVYSLDADEEFLAWAEANQGCTGLKTPTDAHFRRGQDISIEKASPAKREFVELWDAVAEQEGLPTRSVDKF